MENKNNSFSENSKISKYWGEIFYQINYLKKVNYNKSVKYYYPINPILSSLILKTYYEFTKLPGIVGYVV